MQRVDGDLQETQETSRMRSVRLTLGSFLGEQSLLVMLILLIVLFTVLNNTFLTVANFKTVLEQNAALFVVSVGMTFAIMSRNIDLSPGALIALAGVIIGVIFTATGSIALGILGGFGTAILVEVFNGVLISRAKLNPLIVTLAALIWCRGLAISFTGADSIIITGPFIDFMNSSDGITPPLIMIVAAYVVGWFLLNRTRLGRYTQAIGSDERATIQAGVNTNRYKLLMFAVMGMFVGAATVATVSRLGAAAPDAAYGLELDAIVAVIIGGNPFQGGEGSLRRTFLGALFIAILNNGLNNLGMRDSYFYMYKGLAIVVALLFGVVSARLLRGGIAPTADTLSSEAATPQGA